MPSSEQAPPGPDSPCPLTAVDDTLASEQHHLDRARAALGRMRARTADLDAGLSGDWVSAEYLKSTLIQRMHALQDDPQIPLFFGRLDTTIDEDPTRTSTESRFYIGRRHVSDEHGDPMVVDWRAPVSRPFYRASAQHPMGVRLRRRFGFARGTITAYEDEHLDATGTEGSGTSGTSETSGISGIVAAEVERPRTGPMRDIVATIQPDQDDIVRADLATSLCVQGAPGTGKTAVGLHRAAYLLYAHRDQLTRHGVLVLGPNDSFLRYIADVLPALGEIDARQSTIDELVGQVRIRRRDTAAAARVKGDARMAQVLRRALWASMRSATDTLVLPRGSRRWRVPAYQANEVLEELAHRGVRYGAGRGMLPHRLAHLILVKMEAAGEAPDDRVHDAVARSRPVKAYVDRLWPAVDPRRLVMSVLGEADALAGAAEGILTPEEQAVIRWPRPARGPGSAPWSLHDAVLVDEARDLVERTSSVGHVVLDEAQDLSPMMLRAVGRRCSTGSVTVLGDLAQRTTPWGTPTWDDALHHLGKSAAAVQELTTGFRVPGDVLDFAARLLPQIAPTLSTPIAVRHHRGELVVEASTDPVATAVGTVQRLALAPGSIGVVIADAQADAVGNALSARGIGHSAVGSSDDVDSSVDVVPATLAKGLEFDHVVLVEPADIVGAEPDEMTGLRRLYVGLTRAVSSLAVIHRHPLPRVLCDQ